MKGQSCGYIGGITVVPYVSEGKGGSSGFQVAEIGICGW